MTQSRYAQMVEPYQMFRGSIFTTRLATLTRLPFSKSTIRLQRDVIVQTTTLTPLEGQEGSSHAAVPTLRL